MTAVQPVGSGQSGQRTEQVQVFGVKSHSGVRKAFRFFKERRVPVHFMDFKRRKPSKGELRRFFEKFGADAMVDRDAKPFRALGLRSAHYGDARWLAIACEEPLILHLPLVRAGSRLSVGVSEATWRGWVDAGG